MKQKLLILQGLPASGKSTYAKQLVENEGYKRVNKDDLRAMIDNGKWSEKNEKEVVQLRDIMIMGFLDNGYNVVVDDTNFAPKHLETFRSFTDLPFVDVELEIKLIDTPLYECIERDAKREHPVGQKVIMKMYNQYLHKVPSVIPTRTALRKCIIVDIDGTLAYMNGRTPFEYNKVKTDVANRNLAMIISAIKDSIAEVIIVSGREDNCRQETEEWLSDNGIKYREFHMRKTGDMRDDTIVKEEIFNEVIKDKYEVLAVFDDRPKVVRMWQKLGLFVMQCGRLDHRIEF